MTSPHSSVSQEMIHALGWSLVHFVWQGAILTALLFAALVALRRRSPEARYVAACVALGIMALCPFVTAGVLFTQRADQPARPVIANSASFSELSAFAADHNVSTTIPESWEHNPSRLQPEASTFAASPIRTEARRALHLVTLSGAQLREVVWLWLCGVVVLSVRLVAGLIGLSRLRRRDTTPVSQELQRRVDALAHSMGLRTHVSLFQSARVQVPTVVGGIRSVILAPASALMGLPTAQLEAILAHELAHVRRYDTLINLAQVGIETVLFYHPAVWWVSHRIRIEREHCCDDLAVAALGDRVTYARALTALEEMRGVQAPLALAATGGDLLSRIRYVLGRRTTTFSPSPATTVGVASMLLCAALGVAAFLPAQSSPHRQDPAHAKAATVHPLVAVDHALGPIVSDALKLTAQTLRSLGTTGDESVSKVSSQHIAGLARLVLCQATGDSASSTRGDAADPPDSTAGAQQSGAGDAEAHENTNADRHDVAQQGTDEARQARDASRRGADAAGEALDAVGKQMETLGRQLDQNSLTAQQRADLVARITEMSKKLSSLISDRVNQEVRSAARQSLDQSRGAVKVQVEQALREAQAAIQRAMKDDHLSSDVTRALRDAHIDEQVARAMRDVQHSRRDVQRSLREAHIDEHVRRALKDANIDASIQRGLEGTKMAEQVLKSLRDAHIGDQIDRAMRDMHVSDQVQRALRDAHVGDQVQRAMRDAHVSEHLQRALRDAHVDEQVSRALKQAQEEIQRALKEANLNIQLSTGDHDSGNRNDSNNRNQSDDSDSNDH